MEIPGFKQTTTGVIGLNFGDLPIITPEVPLSGPYSPTAEQLPPPADATITPENDITGSDDILEEDEYYDEIIDRVPCHWHLIMEDDELVGSNSTSQETYRGPVDIFNELMRG
jgi:hypothetical protein